MSTFPHQLDGANVLWIAPAIPGQTGHDYETAQPVPICDDAVSQYAGDEPRAYLLAVDSDHNVVADTLWDSPEEAMRAAVDSGFVRHENWKRHA